MGHSAMRGDFRSRSCGGKRFACTWLILASLALLQEAVASASFRAVQPVAALEKVTQMLQQMKANGEKSKSEADTQHQDASTTCESTALSKAEEIEQMQLNIGTWEAETTQLSVSIEQLGPDIQGYYTDLERMHQNLDIARNEYSDTLKQIAKDRKSYEEGIAAINKAKQILEARSKEISPEFLATLLRGLPSRKFSRGNLRKSSSQASFLERDPADNPFSKDESLFDNSKDVAQATQNYESTVQPLEGVLDSVSKQIIEFRDKLIEEQINVKQAHSEANTNYEEQIKSTEGILALAKESLATDKGALATKTQNLHETKVAHAAAVEFRDKLALSCEQQQKDYEEMDALRVGEITALTRGIELVSAMGGDSTGGDSIADPIIDASFLRIGVSRSRVSPVPGQSEKKVLGFLWLQAKKLSSAALDGLANEVSASVEAAVLVADGTSGPSEDAMMEKVKGMIQELVTKLLAESAAETSQSAWCKTEIKKNVEATEKAKTGVDTHSLVVKKFETDLAKLELEIKDVSATLAKGESDKLELENERNQSRVDNEAAIQDAEASSSAVEAARILIQDYYKSASKSLVLMKHSKSLDKLSTKNKVNGTKDQPFDKVVAGPQVGESQGLLAMLEVVRDGYQSVAKKVKANEDREAANYVTTNQKLEVLIAETVKVQSLKLEAKTTLETNLVEKRVDLNASKQELSDAETTGEHLKQPCTAGDTYEERKLKREGEIEALNEVLEMIGNSAQGEFLSMIAKSASMKQATKSVRAIMPAARSRSITSSTATSGEPKLDVVRQFLLQLKVEVQSNINDDKKEYEDGKSWCDNAITTSQASLTESTGRETELEGVIERTAAGKAVSDAQLKRHRTELAQLQKSLQSGGSLRERERELFQKTVKELVQSISSLKNALHVLHSRYGQSGTGDEDEVVSETETSLANVATEVKKVLKLLPLSERHVVNSITDNQVFQELMAGSRGMLRSAGSNKLSQIATATRQTGPDGRQIFEILHQLLATFQIDLQAAQTKEDLDKTHHEGLMQTLQGQIDALQSSIVLKEDTSAQDGSANANAKQDLVGVRESMKNERENLLGLQKHCAQLDGEYQMRHQSRSQELQSVSLAIDILKTEPASDVSSDVVIDDSSFAVSSPVKAANFTKGVQGLVLHTVPTLPKKLPQKAIANPEVVVDTFLRLNPRPRIVNAAAKTVGKSSRPAPRGRDSVTLSVAAATKRLLSASAVAPTKVLPQLAILSPPTLTKAVMAQLLEVISPDIADGLVIKVAAVINTVATNAKEDMKREAKFHDTCRKEKHEALLQLKQSEHEQAGFNATVQRLGSSSEETGVTVTELKEQIEELTTQITQAKETRNKENAEFLQAVDKQKDQQGKVRQAMKTLESIYGKVFLEISKRTDIASVKNDPSDGTSTSTRPGFSKEFKHHDSGTGIIAILTLFLEYSQDVVKELEKKETTSLDAHAEHISSLTKLIESKTNQIVDLEAKKNTGEVDQAEIAAQFDAVTAEVKDINNFLAIVEEKCGHILQNFAASQSQWQSRIDNLRVAREAVLGLEV